MLPRIPRLLWATAPLLAVACSHTGDGITSAPTAPFTTTAHTPETGAVAAYLNDPVTVSFSTQLDLASVTPATFVVEELDANGEPTDAIVAG